MNGNTIKYNNIIRYMRDIIIYVLLEKISFSVFTVAIVNTDCRLRILNTQYSISHAIRKQYIILKLLYFLFDSSGRHFFKPIVMRDNTYINVIMGNNDIYFVVYSRKKIMSLRGKNPALKINSILYYR